MLEILAVMLMVTQQVNVHPVTKHPANAVTISSIQKLSKDETVLHMNCMVLEDSLWLKQFQLQKYKS